MNQIEKSGKSIRGVVYVMNQSNVKVDMYLSEVLNQTVLNLQNFVLWA